MMLEAPWLWSHLSFGLAVGAIIVRLFPPRVASGRGGLETTNGDGLGARRSKARGWLLLGVALATGLIPLGDIDLAGNLLGFTGELSVTTLAYLAAGWARGSGFVGPQSRPGLEAPDPEGLAAGRWPKRTQPLLAERVVWSALGVALYLPALSGRGPDVYGIGYDATMAWAALAVATWLALVGHWGLACLGMAIVLCWQMRLSGGGNFWDYAIDPFVFIASVFRLVGDGLAKRFRRDAAPRTNGDLSLKMKVPASAP